MNTAPEIGTLDWHFQVGRDLTTAAAFLCTTSLFNSYRTEISDLTSYAVAHLTRSLNLDDQEANLEAAEDLRDFRDLVRDFHDSQGGALGENTAPLQTLQRLLEDLAAWHQSLIESNTTLDFVRVDPLDRDDLGGDYRSSLRSFEGSPLEPITPGFPLTTS